MNNLSKTLLGGVAVTALAAGSAVAAPSHPAMHVTALHAGHAVNKTKFHIPGKQHITYTYNIYSSDSASSVDQDIFGTYYKWNSAPNGVYTLCSNPKQKVKTPKKTVYGSTKADTESYSFGCPSGLTVFHGDAWTNKTGVAGNTDTWHSALKGSFQGPSAKYKGTINFNVSVNIF
ncbi:MAG TPA: hypothetical protein VHW24_18035 [Bryobacteraceae bacterium]|nr:hypothetical protein [Bryobacteraceae bacterium]